MLWCFGNACIFLGWKYDNLEFPFCERGALFQLRPLGYHCSVALKRNFRGLRKGSPVQNMTNSWNKKSLSLSLLFAWDRINSFVWKVLLHWNELKLLHDILWVSFIFSRRDRSETFLELWCGENKGNSFSIASISILSLHAHRERGKTKSFNACWGTLGEIQRNKSLGSVLGEKNLIWRVSTMVSNVNKKGAMGWCQDFAYVFFSLRVLTWEVAARLLYARTNAVKLNGAFPARSRSSVLCIPALSLG